MCLALASSGISLVNDLKVRHYLNLELPWLAGDTFYLFIIAIINNKNSKSTNFDILEKI